MQLLKTTLIASIVILVGVIAWKYLPIQKSSTGKTIAAPTPTPQIKQISQSPTYELATFENGDKAQFEINLKGDLGTKQNVEVLVEKTEAVDFPSRSKPILIKVYENNGQKEVFTYTGKEDDFTNEFSTAQVIPNYFEDDKDAIAIVRRSTGYGSGFKDFVTFIAYKDGYKAMEGPTLTELDKFKLEPLKKSILVGRAVYSDDPISETHFDPHKYDLFRYTFDGNTFVTGQNLGKSTNKYDLNKSLDQIIKVENFDISTR